MGEGGRGGGGCGQLRSLSLLVQLSMWEPVCWAAALLVDSHLSSPPGWASRASQEAASTAHHCLPSSRGGEQEAEMTSLALRPCTRDHRAQSLYLQMRKLRTQGSARDLPMSRLSPTHANTPWHQWQTSACYQKPTGSPDPPSGPCCLTSLEYQAKPDWPGSSHTRLASPRLPPQSCCLKGHSQAPV